jgi:hypothetical protein
MIYILLFYVLPVILSMSAVYLLCKSIQETVKFFLKSSLYCLIPLFNIIILIAAIAIYSEDLIENNESIQNFLNKKL